MTEEETNTTSNSTDYWGDLPRRAKSNPKLKYNHIMSTIENSTGIASVGANNIKSRLTSLENNSSSVNTEIADIKKRLSKLEEPLSGGG